MSITTTRISAPFTRRNAIQALALAGLASPVAAVNAALPISVALNRTARFRGNAMRCAKAYTQVHLRVLPEFSQDLLAKVQREMAAGFEALNTANFSAEIAPLYANLRAENVKLMASLAVAPSRNGVVAGSQQADAVFNAANRMVEAIQASARIGNARLINTAGLTRNRSQRLARNFFLLASGVDTKDLRDQLTSDRADFTRALDELSKAPISTPSIRNELSLLQSQWTFFEAALNRRADDESMRNVATTSERIHDAGDALVALYDQALRDLLGSTG